MDSQYDDQTVQSPTSLGPNLKEEHFGLLPSHAGSLSTDVKSPSKSDKPPLLHHMYILFPVYVSDGAH